MPIFRYDVILFICNTTTDYEHGIQGMLNQFDFDKQNHNLTGIFKLAEDLLDTLQKSVLSDDVFQSHNPYSLENINEAYEKLRVYRLEFLTYKLESEVSRTTSLENDNKSLKAQVDTLTKNLQILNANFLTFKSRAEQNMSFTESNNHASFLSFRTKQ